MSVTATKRFNRQFPVGIAIRDENGNKKSWEKFTLKAAKEFRLALDEAIDWAVFMENIRKEREAKS